MARIWVPRTATRGELDLELGRIRWRAKVLLGMRRNLYATDADAKGNTCHVGIFTATPIEYHLPPVERAQIELARGRTWDEALQRAALAIQRGAARGYRLDEEDPPMSAIRRLSGGRVQ